MSKEKDSIYQAIENIAITFDELGFSPTIPIPKGDKAHFIDWFRREVDTIKAICEQQDQRIAELEEQLKNAIVPKFKIGHEVWWVDTRVNSFNEQRYRIESYLIDSIVITKEQFRYYGDDGSWLGDNELFATKEEAQAKLEELKGENK